MQRLQVQLIDTLSGDKAHGGRRTASATTRLALEEGLHKLPRHQLHVVAVEGS